MIQTHLKYTFFFFNIVNVSIINATNLEPISIVEKAKDIAVVEIDDELQVNSLTLSEKLINNVNINQTDSATNTAVISVRGNNFRATDYYEDGIPLYRTANGFVDLSMYSDNDMSIDVNLGGAQSIYGPSAVGGEIILNSKKMRDGISGFIDTSLSTNSTFMNVLFANKTDKYYLKAMVNGFNQNSFLLSEDFSYTVMQRDNTRVNSDKKQLNTYLKMGYKIDSQSEVALKISYIKNEFGLPINIYDEPSNSFSTQADYMRVDNKELTSYWFYYDYVSHKFKVTARLYYDEYTDTFNFYTTPSFTEFKFDESVYEDGRLGSILSCEYNTSDKQSSKITLKIDKYSHKQNIGRTAENEEYETFESSLAYLHTYEVSDKLSATASFQYKKQQLVKVFEFNNENLKYNDHEAVDSQLTFKYNYNTKQSYYFSIARKNRFASLVELFPFFPWDTPTQNVKPEKATSIEVGAQVKLRKDTRVKISTYYNKLDNQIIYDGNLYKNSEQVKVKGIELYVYNNTLRNNDLELSYAYTDAKDMKGNQALYIPTSKVNVLDKLYIRSDLEFLLNYLYNSSIKDIYNSQSKVLSGYTLVDLQLAYYPSNHTTFKVGVNNCLDENWESRYAQPSEGRSFFVNFKYDF